VSIDGQPYYSATDVYPFPFDSDSTSLGQFHATFTCTQGLDRFNAVMKLGLGGAICFGPVSDVLRGEGSRLQKSILDLGYVVSLPLH
jgi:hypothetical protein